MMSTINFAHLSGVPLKSYAMFLTSNESDPLPRPGKRSPSLRAPVAASSQTDFAAMFADINSFVDPTPAPKRFKTSSPEMESRPVSSSSFAAQPPAGGARGYFPADVPHYPHSALAPQFPSEYASELSSAAEFQQPHYAGHGSTSASYPHPLDALRDTAHSHTYERSHSRGLERAQAYNPPFEPTSREPLYHPTGHVAHNHALEHSYQAHEYHTAPAQQYHQMQQYHSAQQYHHVDQLQAQDQYNPQYHGLYDPAYDRAHDRVQQQHHHQQQQASRDLVYEHTYQNAGAFDNCDSRSFACYDSRTLQQQQQQQHDLPPKQFAPDLLPIPHRAHVPQALSPIPPALHHQPHHHHHQSQDQYALQHQQQQQQPLLEGPQRFLSGASAGMYLPDTPEQPPQPQSLATSAISYCCEDAASSSTPRSTSVPTSPHLVQCFACAHPGCDKAFANHTLLLKHEKIHNDQRPWVCDEPGCDKAYTDKSSLTKHKRKHTGERPHTCDVCGRAFALVAHLTRHRMIHSGDKPHACPIEGCDKRFVRVDDLKTHIRVHTGERPYVCPFDGCHKAFTQASALARHRRTQHSSPAAPNPFENDVAAGSHHHDFYP